MVEHLHAICAAALIATIVMLVLILLLLLLASINEGRDVATLDYLVRRQELQALVFNLSVLLPAVCTHVKLRVKHSRPPLLRIGIRLPLWVILVDHGTISRLLLRLADRVSRCCSLRPLR